MTIAQNELRKMSDSELELLADEIKYVREWRKHNQNLTDGTDEAQERDYIQQLQCRKLVEQFQDKEPDWVLVRELGTRLGNILVLKHHHTAGIPFYHLKQLRRMVFAYGEEFIEKDFSEWCDTPDAARAATTKYPPNSYFKTFDTRILALREDVPASPTVEKIEPRDTKLQQAAEWLEFALRDGAPHRTKELFERAGNAVPRIRRSVLERAYAGMLGHVEPFMHWGRPGDRQWYWQLKPEQLPQTTGIFEVSG